MRCAACAISAASWKPDRISFSLPGYVVDVADGEDAGLAGLELLGVDGDQVLVEVEAPVGDRSELHGEPEERQQRVAGDRASRPSFVLTVTAVELRRPRRRARSIWPMRRSILPSATSARICSTECGAPRNSSRRCTSVSAAGDRLQVQRPVERASRRRRRSPRPCRGNPPSCARRRTPTCPRRPRCRRAAAASA